MISDCITRSHCNTIKMCTESNGGFKDITINNCVVINNVVATCISKIGCSITRQPGHPIENVSLSNLQLHFDDGGPRDLAMKAVEKLPKKYPACTMFGELPAYGFYCRHVKGLRFANVQFRTAVSDLRHALVFDYVEALAIDGLDAAWWPGGAAVLSLIQTRGALVRGCQTVTRDGVFLRLAGDAVRNVTLLANDFSLAGHVIELA
jgi:hypothetical protein